MPLKAILAHQSPSLTAPAQAPERQAAFIRTLHEACYNEHNRQALTRATGLLPSLFLQLEGRGSAAAAAVQLLDLASGHEPLRQQMARMLKEGGGSGKSGSRAEQLLALLASEGEQDVAVQAAALGLLGNCAVEHSAKAALRVSLAGNAAAQPAGAFDVLLPLLRSKHRIVARRAAGLMGNLSCDSALRRSFWASEKGASAGLVSLLSLLPRSEQAQQRGDEAELAEV